MGGLLDGVPIVGDAEDALGTAGTALVDIPADAINATTGTGQNLGWFGEIDRHLDYRSLTGELDPNDDSDWADPTTEEAQGFSGAFHAVSGQTASAGGDAIDVGGDVATAVTGEIWDEITNSPVLLGLLLLVGIYVVGQLFDIGIGGSSA